MSRRNLLVTPKFFKVIKAEADCDDLKEDIAILSDCSKIADEMQSR